MPRKKKPVLGVDYVICEDGHAQFTRDYLIRKGTCCEHACRFCPYECATHERAAGMENQQMYQCSVKMAG